MRFLRVYQLDGVVTSHFSTAEKERKKPFYKPVKAMQWKG
jgi:hypothetical protein